MFLGFSKEALGFLGRLERNNNRDWFEANRQVYLSELLEPAKQFVESMGRELDRISPDILADPRVNGSIRRINRDTRFSPDKRPYKNHFDLFFIYSGANREGPGYFLRLTQKKIGIGVGTHRFDKHALDKFRRAVAGPHGKELTARLDKLVRAGYSLGGEHYKRVPRGYDPESERAALLKYAGLYAHSELTIPRELHTPKFTNYCTAHFKNLAPLAQWLRQHVKQK